MKSDPQSVPPASPSAPLRPAAPLPLPVSDLTQGLEVTEVVGAIPEELMELFKPKDGAGGPR
jgi:hypothetical protein